MPPRKLSPRMTGTLVSRKMFLVSTFTPSAPTPPPAPGPITGSRLPLTSLPASQSGSLSSQPPKRTSPISMR